MKTLTLVRHAKSSWDQPQLRDFDRPLNERGQRDAPRMAQYVQRTLPRPDLMLYSPALRAMTTARVFADALSVPEQDLRSEPGIYDASVEMLLRIVQALPDAATDVMLFGHNPGLSDFACRLAACPFDDMPTCAVVRIRLPVARWADVTAGGGEVDTYLSPKTLPD